MHAHVRAVDKVCISKYPKMAGDYIDANIDGVYDELSIAVRKITPQILVASNNSHLLSHGFCGLGIQTGHDRQIIFALPCWGSQLEDLKKTTGRVGDSRGLAEHKVSYSLGEQVGASCWQKSSAPPHMALPQAA